MEVNRIALTFQCPVKWNSMQTAEHGKYCAVCKKTVKDFKGCSVTEVQQAEEAFSCGSFEAVQLHQPFGDKRDVLIAHYQRFVNSTGTGKRLMFLLIASLVFITGCRSRRLGGAYATFKADTKPVHQEANQPKAS